MAVIGVFAPTRDGGWSGTIRTLTIDAKLRFVPNDNRSVDNAPAYVVLVGRSEIGAAWAQRTSGDNPREYLSVKIDDPCLPEAIFAALFEMDDGQGANLVWTRRQIGDRT